jgi:chaperonin GroEL (HSP60 family)
MELTDGCVGFQSMIELSRTQDEEVGDGTTSVIILGKLPI